MRVKTGGVQDFAGYSLENVNDSGRIPTTKEVMPSKAERVQRTYNEDIIVGADWYNVHVRKKRMTRDTFSPSHHRTPPSHNRRNLAPSSI